MYPICGICGSGVSEPSSPLAWLRTREIANGENEITSQFEPEIFCRTYVCVSWVFNDADRTSFRLEIERSTSLGICEFVRIRKHPRTVASRHCVQPKINGPLFYVHLIRSEEGKQGWGNPGNGQVIDPAINAHVPVDRELTRTCLPRNESHRRARTTLGLMGVRCV